MDLINKYREGNPSAEVALQVAQSTGYQKLLITER